MDGTIKLKLVGITKVFPGVKALDKVDITLRKGTVHAIMGENGAGKSTLMKVINGLYQQDEGEYYIDGQKVVMNGPIDAARRGIAMIYQELNFFPDLSIEENLFIGNQPSRFGFVDWKELRSRVRKLLKENGLDYDPAMKIAELSVSQIQMLEIVKAIASHADTIIMDEPTSSISDVEVNELFKTIDKLRDKGVSILYISHKMDEIFRIADDITVLRDGKTIISGPASDFTEDSLISYMVGRPITNFYPKVPVPIGNVIFETRHLCSKDTFEDINITLRKGEVVGIAGLIGAGRTEMVRTIFGLDPYDSGELYLDGKQISTGSVKKAVNNGILMLSEDRRREGVIGIRSIRENISLAKLHASRGFLLHLKKEAFETAKMAKNLNVKASSLEDSLETLSGGNQQKVMLCRWLSVESAKVLILDEPTRGIDVGAKQEIYSIISELVKNEGLSILMISSELPELIGMCDRIYVMKKGYITGELSRDQFSQEAILRLAI